MPFEPRPEGRGHVPYRGTCHAEGQRGNAETGTRNVKCGMKRPNGARLGASPVAPKGSLREGGVFSSHGRKAVEWRRPGNPSFFLFEPRRGDGTLSGLAPGREDNHICAGRWVEEKGMDRMVSLRGNKYCVLSNRLAPSRGQATSRPAHYQVSVKFFA